MNSELFEALTLLEKEKNISKDTLLDAIKQSLLQACKNHYGKAEANNVIVNIDPQTCEFRNLCREEGCGSRRGSACRDQPDECKNEGFQIRAWRCGTR